MFLNVECKIMIIEKLKEYLINVGTASSEELKDEDWGTPNILMHGRVTKRVHCGQENEKVYYGK